MVLLTGSDVEGDDVRDTRVVVRELFEAARRSVLVVGYAFHGCDPIFAPLADRMAARPELAVRVILNVHRWPRQPAGASVAAFARDFWRASWPHHPQPWAFYADETPAGPGGGLARVHAKLIVVDALHVYVGSANFTEAAFHRNLEAGLRLRSAPVGRQLEAYFEGLVAAGFVHPLPP